MMFAILILLRTFTLIQSQTPERISVVVAEVGETVTLTCPVSMLEPLLYWHKFHFGFMPQTVVSGSHRNIKVTEEFSGSRLNYTKVEDQHHLQITNVTQEDEATYLCESVTPYSFRFVNVTHLKITDKQKKHKCFHVKQTPQSVQPGDSTPLQCSLFPGSSATDPCPDGVYWFRTGARDSLPDVIYSPRNRSDEQSCHYSLLRAGGSLDSGVYYCAALTCGRVLFGPGTTVESEQEVKIIIIVLTALVAVCLVVIVALLIARNKVGKEGRAVSCAAPSQATDRGLHPDGDVEGVSYAALNFPMRKSKRLKYKSEECIYSQTSAAYIH
ncbi:uncharacterized protein LOC128767403 [Synchiropus splendidus]|uniref:uncharacterized protein LOC128767403 n=1 Tax=Synchiropus splendidus TaxID=270530 RepID=UPI00237E2D66|nr:uncharacterized protein LOC128767403 [Synchiropus splendidus]